MTILQELDGRKVTSIGDRVFCSRIALTLTISPDAACFEGFFLCTLPCFRPLAG